MNATGALCPLPHRHNPNQPRHNPDGQRICRGCSDRLVRALQQLPDQHDQLARMLAPQNTGPAPKVTGTPTRPLPINPAVAEHRDQIRRVLASWAATIAAERTETPPPTPNPQNTAPWLLRRCEWALRQQWADLYAAETLQLSSGAWNLLYPDGRRCIHIGQCVEYRNRIRCLGQLTASVAHTDTLLPPTIDCDTCGTRHTADRWVQLGRKIHSAA